LLQKTAVTVRNSSTLTVVQFLQHEAVLLSVFAGAVASVAIVIFAAVSPLPVSVDFVAYPSLATLVQKNFSQQAVLLPATIYMPQSRQ